MSAILVKMPPAMRSAAAPSDSPMAKPMKQGPAIVAGDEQQDAQHDQQFDGDQHHADAHARLAAGSRSMGIGLAPQAANAVRELAKVLTRMPNHATP